MYDGEGYPAFMARVNGVSLPPAGQLEDLVRRRAAAARQLQPIQQEVPIQIGSIPWLDIHQRGPRYGDSMRIENDVIARKNAAKLLTEVDQTQPTQSYGAFLRGVRNVPAASMTARDWLKFLGYSP